MSLQALRKFGLAHCDLPTMMWNVASLLRLTTLNIDTRHTERIPVIVYIVCVVIAAGYFYVYLFSGVWFVVWRCSETGDVLAALIVFSLVVSSEIGTVKLVCMFIYRKNIQKIVSDCLACDALVMQSPRFASNLLTTLRLVKKRAMVFWMIIIINGVVYIAKALLTPGRHFMDDTLVLFGLEPMYESPNYEISFLLMSCGVVFTCYLPANVTALLIVSAGYIEALLLAWSEELRHLWEDAKRNTDCRRAEDRSAALNRYVNERLKEIIRGHSATVSLHQQVEVVFRGAIAFEFVMLAIGLIAELLGGLENTYIEVPFALGQVAMDCLVGQRVMDASITFERAVYESQWEHLDSNNMKLIQLMLQSSQKRLALSAGGIATLSFTCLMSVVRSIYSAYTTLRTTMK